MKSRKKQSKPRNRAGLLPGEYRRRGLVTLEVTKFADPRRSQLTGEPVQGEETPDQYGRIVHNYVVVTSRLDGQFSAQIEFKGETYRLPGKVIDQIIRHRTSIMEEQKRDRNRQQSERMRAQAEADQAEAEEQRRMMEAGKLN